jgi:hypothetical protein
MLKRDVLNHNKWRIALARRTEAIGRLVSVALQDGVDAGRVIDQLCSVKCPTAMAAKDRTDKPTHFIVAGSDDHVYVKSCSDAVGKAIKMAMQMEARKA